MIEYRYHRRHFTDFSGVLTAPKDSAYGHHRHTYGYCWFNSALTVTIDYLRPLILFSLVLVHSYFPICRDLASHCNQSMNWIFTRLSQDSPLRTRKKGLSATLECCSTVCTMFYCYVYKKLLRLQIKLFYKLWRIHCLLLPFPLCLVYLLLFRPC
jgi:hypothetical protein